MARVVIITGGNIGEVEGNLKRAKQMVGQRVGEIIEKSKVYGSEPWGSFRRAEREEGAGEAGEGGEGEDKRSAEVEQEEMVEEARCARAEGRERREEGDNKVRGFLNQVLIVETKLEAIEVLDAIQQIERELGRVREKGEEREAGRVRSGGGEMERGDETERCYRSRTMDIDILYYDNIVMESQRLVIPHPMIEKREFVLVPLAELMPNYKDPRTGKTVKQMLKKLL